MTAAGPQAPLDTVPVCPRHPDRESYVRCQRCERPTCPACQRQAPVGIQCVDCVREGARSQRTARSTFGGRLTTGRPVVTLTIMATCVVLWLAQLAFPPVTDALEFVPLRAASQPWRFLTAAFLHSPSSFLHILFNMYALWLTGPYLESLLGRVRFAALYLLAAVGGSVGSLVLASPTHTSWYTASVGASGAVFGIFGALFIVQRRLHQGFGQIVTLIVLNGVLGFIVPGIAWQAHLGGLVTGLLLGVVLAHAPARGRTQVQVVGTVAVALLIAAAAVVKLLVSPVP